MCFCCVCCGLIMKRVKQALTLNPIAGEAVQYCGGEAPRETPPVSVSIGSDKATPADDIGSTQNDVVKLNKPSRADAVDRGPSFPFTGVPLASIPSPFVNPQGEDFTKGVPFKPSTSLKQLGHDRQNFNMIHTVTTRLQSKQRQMSDNNTTFLSQDENALMEGRNFGGRNLESPSDMSSEAETIIDRPRFDTATNTKERALESWSRDSTATSTSVTFAHKGTYVGNPNLRKHQGKTDSMFLNDSTACLIDSSYHQERIVPQFQRVLMSNSIEQARAQSPYTDTKRADEGITETAELRKLALSIIERLDKKDKQVITTDAVSTGAQNMRTIMGPHQQNRTHYHRDFNEAQQPHANYGRHNVFEHQHQDLAYSNAYEERAQIAPNQNVHQRNSTFSVNKTFGEPEPRHHFYANKIDRSFDQQKYYGVNEGHTLHGYSRTPSNYKIPAGSVHVGDGYFEVPYVAPYRTERPRIWTCKKDQFSKFLTDNMVQSFTMFEQQAERLGLEGDAELFNNALVALGLPFCRRFLASDIPKNYVNLKHYMLQRYKPKYAIHLPPTPKKTLAEARDAAHDKYFESPRDEILKEGIIAHAPPQIRSALRRIIHKNISDFERDAESIFETHNRNGGINAVKTTTKQTTHRTSPKEDTGANKSVQQENNDELQETRCWYHIIHGEKAFKCEGEGCDMFALTKPLPNYERKPARQNTGPKND